MTEGKKKKKKVKGKSVKIPQTYIPYRESKLTTILKESLGGNSFSLMIANLSPIDNFVEESLQTLQYASKAQFISNQPKINQDPRTKLINE